MDWNNFDFDIFYMEKDFISDLFLDILYNISLYLSLTDINSLKQTNKKLRKKINKIIYNLINNNNIRLNEYKFGSFIVQNRLQTKYLFKSCYKYILGQCSMPSVFIIPHIIYNINNITNIGKKFLDVYNINEKNFNRVMAYTKNDIDILMFIRPDTPINIVLAIVEKKAIEPVKVLYGACIRNDSQLLISYLLINNFSIKELSESAKIIGLMHNFNLVRSFLNIIEYKLESIILQYALQRDNPDFILYILNMIDFNTTELYINFIETENLICFIKFIACKKKSIIYKNILWRLLKYATFGALVHLINFMRVGWVYNEILLYLNIHTPNICVYVPVSVPVNTNISEIKKYIVKN